MTQAELDQLWTTAIAAIENEGLRWFAANRCRAYSFDSGTLAIAAPKHMWPMLERFREPLTEAVSAQLGQPCRLLWLPASTHRPLQLGRAPRTRRDGWLSRNA